mgnify:CR=1 FL=1
MTDKKLIETIARIWVENGGDEEGLDWCYLELREAIRELREKENED